MAALKIISVIRLELRVPAASKMSQPFIRARFLQLFEQALDGALRQMQRWQTHAPRGSPSAAACPARAFA